ncbi:hypothetical protein E3E29_07815 [Thermococcus sp. Bubb.Bath]|nr:hypothetical protein [Thermococcus sp. Bubb.Bath]
MNVLSNAPLSSLVNESVLRDWSRTGVLNTSLYVSPSTPPLKIALMYWALSNISTYENLHLEDKARTIIEYVITHNFPGYGFQFKVNSTTIAEHGNISNASDITAVSAIMSGFQRGKRPIGYISRAYLTYAQHRYSQLIGIQRIVAGGDGNTLYVDIPVDLPDDAADISAKGAFYARIIGYNGNKISLTISNSNGDTEYGDLGSGGKVDLSNYLLPGSNILRFTIDSGGADEVGFGSGSVLLTSYTTNSTSYTSPDRVDLYNVTSYYGFVQFVTVVPTGNVTSTSIYLKTTGVDRIHLYYNNGTGICDMGLSKSPVDGITYFSSDEIESGLSRCGVTYSNLNKRAFTFVIGFDATWPSGSSNPEYSTTYRERHLYGFGQSFVEVTVNSKVNAVHYAIPLSIPLYPEDFSYPPTDRIGSGVYRTMSTSYTLPPKAIPWYADYWTAIEYQGSAPTGTLTFFENGGTIISGPLNYYLYRFGYAKYADWMMKNGSTNIFRASSSSDSYGFREGQSWGTVYYFLQAYAPYGKPFPKLLQGYPVYKGYNLTYYAKLYGSSSQPEKRYILIGKPPYKPVDISNLQPKEYSVDDAILRLFSKLAIDTNGKPGSQDNPLAVLLPPSVKMEFSAMNAPSLFKPVPIELKLWRLG